MELELRQLEEVVGSIHKEMLYLREVGWYNIPIY
jgi:hypothetical protein